MAEVEVERAFIGAGCNRIVNNVSWGPSGLVAFGAQHAVAIFCPQTAQILTTLPGHKATVNCTQWLPTSKDAFIAQSTEKQYLLSGSADGVIMVWEVNTEERKWRHALQVPELHKKGVTCLTGMMVSQSTAIFASTSSDGIVLVWELIFISSVGGDCRISCLESINVGSKSMVALSLAELPGDTGHLVLAAGGLDHKVHLYCGERTGKFFHACELKGHTDWIRCLDFSLPVYVDSGEKSLFLVSSSQDRSIRIWKLALHISSASSDVATRKQDIGLTSYIEGPMLLAGTSSYQVSLESLLLGHEDWVYSVEWQPPGTDNIQPMSILSASMDKVMMIWRPERTTGIWVNEVTVGELSHSALGFYGGHWAPDGNSILAYGYGGSFHLWRNVGMDYETWQPQKVPSGHFSSVSDIAWARSGDYLLSVSHDQLRQLDIQKATCEVDGAELIFSYGVYLRPLSCGFSITQQDKTYFVHTGTFGSSKTTRTFAQWKNDLCMKDKTTWHEIARPQVHGHDINCVTIIQGAGNHRFVSGADEKVARVFEAPLSFLKTLKHAVLQSSSNFEDFQEAVQILGANMSALGLSQKPIYVHAASESPTRINDDGQDSLETIPDAVPTVLTEPPIEEQLSWHTLWPETHKLYGHGNELFSLCCDHAGKLVASSCKAQSAAVAEVWLWQVGSWKAVGRLQSHSLTVTQIEFSYDDSFLLTVSRDRQFSVFSIKKSGDGVEYQLIAKKDAHKRIIWACSWNPFGHQFATGSRDKTVKLWTVDGSSVKHLTTLPPFRDSVTALSWTGVNCAQKSGMLAVGMDNGLIELWSLSSGNAEPPLLDAVVAARFDPFWCHVSTVHRLAWRERSDDSDSRELELASCGADHCVRVFKMRL